MNEFVECSICLINYDSRERIPMLLQCQHSFCKICLDELSRSSVEIKCPTCRTTDTRNLNQIQKNRMILNYIENLNANIKKLTTDIPISIEKIQSTAPVIESSNATNEWNLTRFLKESFDNIDHNKDGKISEYELHEALKKGQPNMQFDKKTVQILLAQYDEDNDDEISFKEFYALFMALNDLYNEFLDIDTDCSGYIDSSEIENALRQKGYSSLSSRCFDDLIGEITKRLHIKNISFDVFVRIIARLCHLKYEYKHKKSTQEYTFEELIRRQFFSKF